MVEQEKKILSLKEIQILELEILREIVRVCKILNINYYLTYGTLKGAVTCKGFRPWDDDIDIIIPRSQYQIFLDNFNTLCKSDYQLLSYETRQDYYYSFAKVVHRRTRLREHKVLAIEDLGVYVDVFPLDGMPDNPLKIWWHINWLLFLVNLRYYSVRLYKKKYPGKFSIRIRTRLFRFLLEYIEKQRIRYNEKDSRYLASGINRKIGREVFADIVKVTFEGEEYNAPAGYHEYLKSLYGDYEKPIPPDKQRSNHNFTAWRFGDLNEKEGEES